MIASLGLADKAQLVVCVWAVSVAELNEPVKEYSREEFPQITANCNRPVIIGVTLIALLVQGRDEVVFQGYIPCERHSLNTLSINSLVSLVELIRNSLRIPSSDPALPFLSFFMHLLNSSSDIVLFGISSISFSMYPLCISSVLVFSLSTVSGGKVCSR